MIIDSEPVELEVVPNMLLEISDQIASGASETAPIDTPRVKASRTATALMTHAKGVIRRAAAVLMIFYFLCLLIEQ
jgi:hypothetical protein